MPRYTSVGRNPYGLKGIVERFGPEVPCESGCATHSNPRKSEGYTIEQCMIPSAERQVMKA